MRFLYSMKENIPMTQKKDKPKHLGKGLKALLGPINIEEMASEMIVEPLHSETHRQLPDNFPPDNSLVKAIKEIAVKSILPNPYQPRTHWDQEKLQELADSIKANGIIQPIIVRPSAGGYEIIAGERRFRAAQMVGKDTVPALVRQTTDEEMLEMALVENIHRSDLNPIDRAKAYQRYISTFSLTQQEAADKLGENRSVIANYLRILDLPKDIKDMLINGQLTMGHARALLAVGSDELRRKLANKALVGRLSVRDIERAVKGLLTPKSDKTKEANSKPSHIVDLETRLKQQIGTKVLIDTHKSGQRGKIVIEFYNLDDFDRITEKLGVNLLAAD